jgi:type II secretory pathway component PulF
VIEPLIMIVMGGVVGFIVLAAVLPTVQLIQAL